MSTKLFRCPNCSAERPFVSAATLVVVCEHCAWASRRTDVELESIGKVAMPAELLSNFRLGTRGTFEGEEFIVRGQLQLDHGTGPWNEWCATTHSGSWLWISEAQGKTAVLRPAPESVQRPSRSAVQLGDELRLDGGAPFTVTELGRSTVLTVAGELPIAVQPGERTRYGDCAREDGGFATLDWTREPIEVFVGRFVDLEELALVEGTLPEKRPKLASTQRLGCRNCGGPIQVFDPSSAVTVACQSCGAILEPGSNEVLANQAQKKLTKPELPLGKEATFRGERVRVLGFLRRGVRAGGRLYPWSEYLLRHENDEYTWLVENNGHWIHARSIPATGMKATRRQARFGGLSFKHFDGGEAEVLGVLGEFYWRVRVGDKTHVDDYVAGTEMVSIEKDEQERLASRSTHVDSKEIAAAFGIRPRGARSVGAIQPNPHDAKRAWGLFGFALAALVILHVAYRLRCSDLELFALALRAPTSADEEQVTFSDPFEIRGPRQNLHLHLTCPSVENGWVGVSCALVHSETGAVKTAALEAEYYTGYSDGERWSEGDRKANAWLGPLPAGPYRLRVAAAGFDKGLGAPFWLRATCDEPRAVYFWIAFLVLLLAPIAVSLLHAFFEYERWKNSAHPWGEEE